MLKDMTPVALSPSTTGLLHFLVSDAKKFGATLFLDGRPPAGQATARPTILRHVSPAAEALRTDIFAPLLSFCSAENEKEALAANARCPYALTAAIFGPPDDARRLAAILDVGTVLINDIIVSTADPRTPFGGRGASGFGVTRGREGLLEMTVVKTVIQQNSRSLRPYAVTTARHDPFFSSYIQAVHSGTVAARLSAFRRLLTAAKTVEGPSGSEREPS